MSTFKRVKRDYNIVVSQGNHNLRVVDGDYNIKTEGGLGTNRVIVDTHTLEVRGNMNVVGDLTYINVSELAIKDPFIVINTSETDSYAPQTGLLTHKTADEFAGIRYNQATDNWQVSVATDALGVDGTWDSLVTHAAGDNMQLQFNDNGLFGASDALVFDSTTNTLTIAGTVAVEQTQQFSQLTSDPVGVAGQTQLYHKAAASGGTGLYVKSDSVADELVSRSKAIVFGIIF